MRWRWRTDGAWISAVVWAAVLIFFAIHSYRYPWSHTVYAIYASAARGWWAGQDIYVRGLDYYRYSPLFAIAFSPFAMLPDRWGVALWKTVNCLFYAGALKRWLRNGLPTTLGPRETAWVFLLVLPLSLHSMYNGQANVFMLGCLLFAITAAAQQRWNGAAAWLAAATLIKGYPLGLALLLLVLYGRMFAVRFAAALGVGLALPFVTQPPRRAWIEYQSWVHHLQDSTAIMRERLRSVDQLSAIYIRPLTPHQLLVLSLAAAVVVLGFCLLSAHRNPLPQAHLTRVFMLFTTWVVLFGPATEACTYIVVAPAVAWAIVAAFRPPRAWSRLVLLMMSVFLMGVLGSDAVGSSMRDFWNTHGSQPLGAVLFAGYLLWETWKPRSTLADSSVEPPLPLRRAA